MKNLVYPIWEDLGRFGKTWEDMGRFGKTWEDSGRLGKIWEDLGRIGSIDFFWKSCSQISTQTVPECRCVEYLK